MRKPCALEDCRRQIRPALALRLVFEIKDDLATLGIVKRGKECFVAATIPAVGAPGVEFVWAKLFNPAPNNRIKNHAIFLFIAKLKRNPSHGSTRTRVHRPARRRGDRE